MIFENQSTLSTQSDPEIDAIVKNVKKRSYKKSTIRSHSLTTVRSNDSQGLKASIHSSESEFPHRTNCHVTVTVTDLHQRYNGIVTPVKNVITLKTLKNNFPVT